MLFAIEREINGLSADARRQVRQERSRPLVEDLRTWLGEQRVRLSRSATVAKPIDYMLKRWDRFASFLDDGRVCLTNNAAERALRVLRPSVEKHGCLQAPAAAPSVPPQ